MRIFVTGMQWPKRECLCATAARDLPASGALTQERLAWRPAGPGLIADLEQMRYHETETDVRIRASESSPLSDGYWSN